jgi:PiT family inorganic phosphate transporter
LAAAIWISFIYYERFLFSAVFGFGLAAVGLSHIHFNVLAFSVLSWILSPIISFASGFILYYILRREFIRNISTVGIKDRIKKKYLAIYKLEVLNLQIKCRSYNIAALKAVIYYAFGSGFSMDIKIIGAIGMVLGILNAGGKITGTIGRRITELVPRRGFSAQISIASVVYIFTFLGSPVSLNQTLVGSVMVLV